MRIAILTGLLCVVLANGSPGRCDRYDWMQPLAVRSSDGAYEFRITELKSWKRPPHGTLSFRDAHGRQRIVWSHALCNIPEQALVYSSGAETNGDENVRVFTAGSVEDPVQRHAIVCYDGRGRVLRDYSLDQIYPISQSGMMPHRAALFWSPGEASIDHNQFAVAVGYRVTARFDCTNGDIIIPDSLLHCETAVFASLNAHESRVSEASLNVTISNLSDAPIHSDSSFQLDIEAKPDGREPDVKVNGQAGRNTIKVQSDLPGDLRSGGTISRTVRISDLFKQDVSGDFALRVSARYRRSAQLGREPTVAEIHAQPIVARVRDGRVTTFGRTAGNPKEALDQDLAAAVMEYDRAGVNQLLAQGADPNARYYDIAPGLVFDSFFGSWWHGAPAILLAIRPKYGPATDWVASKLLPYPETDQKTRTAIVQALLDAGADPGGQSERQTPLMAAAEGRHTACALLLLEHGAGTEAIDERGCTALMYAHRQPELLARLIALGANVNAADHDGKTALMYAAVAGDARTVNTLLRSGANLHTRSKSGQNAVLLGAAWPQVLRILLAHGAAIEIDGDRGGAMLFAAYCPASTRIVLDHGADITARNEFGETIVMYAVNGYPGTLKLVLDRGADVNAQVSGKYHAGYTALMIAVVANHSEPIQILLSHHADFSIRGDDGESALSLAVKHNCKEVAALLRKVGARE